MRRPSHGPTALPAAAVVALITALCAGACAGAGVHPKSAHDLSPSSLYPLGAGYAWSYDVDTGDAQPTLAVARVVQVQNGNVTVATGADSVLRYSVRSDGIARADDSGYLLKAPIGPGATWTSGQGALAQVTQLHVTLDTPAGKLTDCVAVDEHNAATGQHITTTYCPGVGPAQVVSEMEVRGQTLRVVARLRGYTVDTTSSAP
jgi:hypothetical protein